MVTRRRQKCVQNHCEGRSNGRKTKTGAPSATKRTICAAEGRKTGNRDQCHVHASSTCWARCRLGSCLVCHRRVDWPCGIHAYKVVLERTAASDIRVPVQFT